MVQILQTEWFQRDREAGQPHWLVELKLVVVGKSEVAWIIFQLNKTLNGLVITWEAKWSGFNRNGGVKWTDLFVQSLSQDWTD